MATMTNASMTVLKSLDTLKKQEKDKKMLAFYNFVIERVILLMRNVRLLKLVNERVSSIKHFFKSLTKQKKWIPSVEKFEVR